MQVLYFGKGGCISNGGIIQVVNLQMLGLDFSLQVIKINLVLAFQPLKKMNFN
jgi:hypothetical protein